jgi:opacity protein-like surface antigen
VYGHYLFSINEKIAVYPSVGLGMTAAKIELDLGALGKHSTKWSDNSWLAFSLGGGIDFALTSNLSLNGELRYKMFSGDLAGGYRTNFAVGLTHKF